MPEDRELKSTREAFEALALEHFDALYNTAVRLTRNPGEAQDLVQETYLKAYRAFDRFDQLLYSTRNRDVLVAVDDRTMLAPERGHGKAIDDDLLGLDGELVERARHGLA